MLRVGRQRATTKNLEFRGYARKTGSGYQKPLLREIFTHPHNSWHPEGYAFSMTQHNFSKTSLWLYGFAGWAFGVFVANLFLVSFILPRNESPIDDFWVILFFWIMLGLGGSDIGRKLYLRKVNGQGILFNKSTNQSVEIHIYQCEKCERFRRVGSDDKLPRVQFCTKCKGLPMKLVNASNLP